MKLEVVAIPSGIWRHLGSCPVCTRKAFAVFCSIWVILCAAILFAVPQVFLVWLEGLAAVVAALWLAHCLAHTMKLTAARRHEIAQAPHRKNLLQILVASFVTALRLSTVPEMSITSLRARGGRLKGKFKP